MTKSEASRDLTPALGRYKPMMPSREWAWLMGIIALFMILNLATADRAAVWQDEVMFTDPAVNAATGHGFTSSAWPYQRAHETWGGNAPLHACILTVWLKIWGASITAVRSINFVYAALSVVLLWWAVRRAGLVSSPWMRLMMVGLILCGNGISYSYRSGRYDMLSMLWVCAAAASMAIGRPWLRMTALFIFSVLMPLSGLQTVPMLGLAVLVMGAFYFKKRWREGAAMLAGLAVGVGLLVGILMSLGVLDALLKWLLPYWSSGHGMKLMEISEEAKRSKIEHVWDTVGGILNINRRPGATQDYSLLPVMIVAAIGLIPQAGRKLRGMLLAISIVLPVGLSLAGQFPSYYTWMAALPAIVAAVMGIEALVADGKKKWMWVIAPLLVMATLVGLPARMGIVAMGWRERDPKFVEDFVRKNIHGGDVVLSVHRTYYAVKATGAKAYFFHTFSMTDQERAEVDTILSEEQTVELFTSEMGGKWKLVAREEMPGGRFVQKCTLLVYRRESAGEPR